MDDNEESVLRKALVVRVEVGVIVKSTLSFRMLSTYSDFHWLISSRAAAPVQVCAPKVLQVLLALTWFGILHTAAKRSKFWCSPDVSLVQRTQ